MTLKNEHFLPPITSTLGYTQISIKGLIQLRKGSKNLDIFLAERGFTNNKLGNAVALLTPTLSPFIIAAKLNQSRSFLETRGIPVSKEAILYGTRPDLWVFYTETKGIRSLKYVQSYEHFGDNQVAQVNAHLMSIFSLQSIKLQKAWSRWSLNLLVDYYSVDIFKISKQVQGILKLLPETDKYIK